MGAEQSTYEGPPEILEARDLSSVAKYMKSSECRNVFVMLGAGVSTSAGIPDFRSPETGLYANLARLNLPYPEAVFEINFFRENPKPFYTLARELLPGRFRPTPTHSFIRLLADRSLLHTCFTQNIDTLERRAGVPSHKIVEAHGSFASQRCIDCSTVYDDEKMRTSLKTGVIAVCPECEGLVKPDIVFFGEALPQRFHHSVPQLRKADLLFVIGTSLTVQPFASLATLVPDHCPRVLINLDAVGDLGSRGDDVLCLGKCDEVVRDLCKALGWEAELDAAWKATENSVVDFDEIPPVDAQPDKGEDQRLREEVEDITEKLERILGAKFQEDSQTSEDGSESRAESSAPASEEIPLVQEDNQPLEVKVFVQKNTDEPKEKL
ncbi:uncharacterized protein FIBRA_05642 [Fibroporia radiculosa]|uniref:NAD-dependent protein deacetylase n=1 Tax=Fibroporia radiculosa TaxID=599839 RepID=J4G9V2_9APHY|nr:uncharacterized protein FIBRA_05642 [Fibroporia radiculosa]CCM03508.1 predicted protein [Fibroporia radiculosa]